MRLQINDEFYISDYADGDQAALVEYLNDEQIYRQTLAIPKNYTIEEADKWLQMMADAKRERGYSINWCMRRRDGKLVGGIGFLGISETQNHRAEIGYWSGRPYWGNGLMTEAVKVVTAYGFRELNLSRITANVFDYNPASMRVLLKSGYYLEAKVRHAYKKDGKIFDGFLLVAIKETWVPNPVERPISTNIILYVSDQKKSSDFYRRILNKAPELDVPGMTEFELSSGAVLGLMPEKGIKRLLGENLPDPEKGQGIPRAEVYLRVVDPELFMTRSIEAGAKLLSPVTKRDWGDNAGYVMDFDGHVLVFAQTIEKS